MLSFIQAEIQQNIREPASSYELITQKLYSHNTSCGIMWHCVFIETDESMTCTQRQKLCHAMYLADKLGHQDEVMVLLHFTTGLHPVNILMHILENSFDL